MRNKLDPYIFIDVFSIVKKKKNQNIYIIIYIICILSENSINASSFIHVDYYSDTIFI